VLLQRGRAFEGEHQVGLREKCLEGKAELSANDSVMSGRRWDNGVSSIQVLLLMLVAIMVCSLIPVQSVVNSRLGAQLANPLLAALISFATGTMALIALYLAVHSDVPRIPTETRIPWYLFTGGIIGVVFITAAILLVPHIGPGNFVAASVVGQLTVALIMDHWGILGVSQQTLSPARVLGAVLLIAGTLLIQRG